MITKKTCPNFRSLVTSTDVQPSRLTVARIRCKKWTCPYCGEKNLNAWRAHLGKTFARKFPNAKWIFITITLLGKDHGKEDKGVPKLQKIWSRLYHRMRRKYGKEISYVYFYEPHKKGTFHIHALLNIGHIYDETPLRKDLKYPLKKHPMYIWLQTTLGQLDAGKQTDVRRIYGKDGHNDASGAVAYALAYFAKMRNWEGFKKGARRIGVSQDIGGLPKASKSSYKWEVRQWLTLSDLYRHGTIYDVSIGRNIGKGDFEQGFYPPSKEE